MDGPLISSDQFSLSSSYLFILVIYPVLLYPVKLSRSSYPILFCTSLCKHTSIPVNKSISTHIYSHVNCLLFCSTYLIHPYPYISYRSLSLSLSLSLTSLFPFFSLSPPSSSEFRRRNRNRTITSINLCLLRRSNLQICKSVKRIKSNQICHCHCPRRNIDPLRHTPLALLSLPPYFFWVKNGIDGWMDG